MQAELRVRVQPRASRNEASGWEPGDERDASPRLHVRLTAPPVEGAANRACRDFVAVLLGLRRGDIELVSGEKSRDKRFRVTGLTIEELSERVRAALSSPAHEAGESEAR